MSFTVGRYKEHKILAGELRKGQWYAITTDTQYTYCAGVSHRDTTTVVEERNRSGYRTGRRVFPTDQVVRVLDLPITQV